MSTNYYLKTPTANIFKHFPDEIHIGKSSVGWTFALHVMPECGIRDLPDMVEWLQCKITTKHSKVVDEYGRELTLLQFLEVVTKRSNPTRIKDGWDNGWWAVQPASLRFLKYTSEQKFHEINHSERGPSGLLRRKIDGEHCIGHGNGTWDLCIGNFS